VKVTFIFKVVSFLILPFLYLNAQSGFNIEQYNHFLQSHENMGSSQLLEMHDAGSFKGNVNVKYNNALYFDSIGIKYNLTNHEKELIGKNSFMVSERLSQESFGGAFLEIYNRDLPVFVSTDAILHAFHISYDRILKDVELGILIDRVTTILNQLYSSISQLHGTYSSNPSMLQMLKDVDVYVTVPRKLFDESVSAYYPENNSVVDDIINEIMSEQGYKTYTLFSENCRVMDWSQFKPRGHYDSDEFPILRKYFRVMMWLGRTEIYLLAPRSYPFDCLPQSFDDIKRQTVDAFLINELFDLAGARPLYDEMEDILQFFVGKSDNVTLPDIQFLKDAVGINDASNLLDSLKLIEFQDTLKNQSFAYQLILSQILTSDPFSPDSIIPASAFLLFGQRFVIDSYVTGSVVYDKIKYNDEKICRLFPSTLDVLFALGNDASAQLLKSELEQYYYSSNLAALRYLIDSYDSDFWKSTLYNAWLGNIRSMNPPSKREDLPNFMQTAAFWQQKMNTQLSSWAQLRHDNLLYAKQSYTGGTVCSYPYGYVEPFPQLYLNLKTIAELGYNKFQSINFSDPWYNQLIADYFSFLKDVSDTLASISKKELNGTQLSQNETDFLKRIIYSRLAGSGTPPYDGWYARLFYDDASYFPSGLLESNNIVADIHTVPTDCGGAPVGWVYHVGTGPVNLGVWVTEMTNGQLTAFIGPVLSYYEYTSTNFKRLTDSEWDETYLYFSMRPDWVNIYLADSLGNEKSKGASLVTSVSNNPDNPVIPESYITVKSYPNPFNPDVIINFSIPNNLTNSKAELVIYDIQGQKIKTLVNEALPTGNYLVKWNATDENGIGVSSGVYIYVLRLAGQQATGKMIFQK
jgi:hypothetical protein